MILIKMLKDKSGTDHDAKKGPIPTMYRKGKEYSVSEGFAKIMVKDLNCAEYADKKEVIEMSEMIEYKPVPKKKSRKSLKGAPENKGLFIK